MPNGSLDSTFGAGGKVTTRFISPNPSRRFHMSGAAVVLQPDGKIVIAGGGVLARYHANGTLDASFANFADSEFESVLPGQPGTAVFQNLGGVSGLARRPDGKFYVIANVASSVQLTRINADGSPDLTFFPSRSHPTRPTMLEVPGATESRALALQGDGKIIVAGGAFAFTLARLNADANADPTFGAGVGAVFTRIGEDVSAAASVLIQADGKIVAAGSADVTVGGVLREAFALARYDATGVLDASFGDGGTVTTDFGGGAITGAFGQAAALQADGKIVVAGGFVIPGAFHGAAVHDAFGVARYNADGSLDASFGPDGKLLTEFLEFGAGESAATAVAVQADGKVVAVGFAEDFFGLARYLPGGPNTPAGTNVSTQVGSVTLTFTNVTAPGNTTVTTSTTGPPPPTGFALGTPPTYFEITTTALFDPPIRVCIRYAGMAVGNEALLQLAHFEAGVWVNRTVSLDMVNDVICAEVPSLSPFTIFEEIDATPPVITAGLSAAPNAAGWNTGAVTVTWTVSDPESGIASSTGCGPVTLGAETGGTTVTCEATNGVGSSASQSVTIKIDMTPPLIACGSADGAWHVTNVAIPCTAADSLSGLADATAASFVLTTAVAVGVETADAATGTRLVCDQAGLCATAGPVMGNRIDRAPPVARTRNVELPADAFCAARIAAAAIDAGSFDPFGDPISLALDSVGPFGLGPHVVTLTVTDNHGGASSATATVTVVDVAPPEVTAALVPAGEIDDDEGRRFRVEFSASDRCDLAPVVSAVMAMPLDTAGFDVRFQREGHGDRARIVFDAGRRRIRLEGRDEPSLRALLETLRARGGAPVAAGQTLRLERRGGEEDERGRRRAEGDEGQEDGPRVRLEFRFEGARLVAHSAPMPTLVVTARDGAGNGARRSVEASFPPRD